MYNLTNITDNANNLYEMAKATNDLSGGLYFSLILTVLFLVYLVVFKKQSFKEVFIGGSFFITIVAAIMFAMKFVTQDFLIAPVIMFLSSIVIYLINKD